jgi:glycosyltransferase involved in cell wall biosynthesis
VRILLLNDRLYPDFIGGVEKRNHDLALALARRGHEVTLAGFGRGPAAAAPGISVRSLGPLGRLYSPSGKRSTPQAFRFAWRVFRLDLSPFDVVEASNIPYIHLVPLALRCRMQRRPLVVTWYEFWGPYWSKYLRPSVAPVYRLAEWLTAQLGVAVVATSRLTGERLAARRIGGGEVAVVACGVPVAALRAAAAGVEAAPGTIVYAGRLIREKRLHLLVDAVTALPPGLGARLVIFGEGPEREALAARIAALGIGERVELRGHVPEAEEVWRTVRAATVAVQPSSREGFGIFPLEAMALGVPVVFADSIDSAVVELVRDGVDGLRVSAEPAALTAALARLLSDGGLRAALGRSAARRAEEYDLERLGGRMEAFLRAAADRKLDRFEVVAE